MIVRIRYKKLGGHIHCRMFTGKTEGSLGKNGDLVFGEAEFESFRAQAVFIQFVPESE